MARERERESRRRCRQWNEIKDRRYIEIGRRTLIVAAARAKTRDDHHKIPHSLPSRGLLCYKLAFCMWLWQSTRCVRTSCHAWEATVATAVAVARASQDPQKIIRSDKQTCGRPHTQTLHEDYLFISSPEEPFSGIHIDIAAQASRPHEYPASSSSPSWTAWLCDVRCACALCQLK